MFAHIIHLGIIIIAYFNFFVDHMICQEQQAGPPTKKEFNWSGSWFIKKEGDDLLYLYELPAKGDPTKDFVQHISSIRCVDDNSTNGALIRVSK